MIDQNVIDKINKIKALANYGATDGEKQSAQMMLDKLTKKYNVSLDDLSKSEEVFHYFRFWGSFGRELLNQVIYAVKGYISVYYGSDNKHTKERMIKCTELEAIEIKEMYLFYRNYLDKGLKNYYDAFVQIEGIFPQDDSLEKIPDDGTKLSEDVISLAMTMNKHNRYKMIEQESKK